MRVLVADIAHVGRIPRAWRCAEHATSTCQHFCSRLSNLTVPISPSFSDNHTRSVAIPALKMLDGVAQKPIEGVSMMYSFDDSPAPLTRRTRYFKLLANHSKWENRP